MNMNGLINMVMRRVIGKLVNAGVNRGIDMASNSKAKKPGQMDDDERAQHRNAKQMQKRAKQAMRVGRKVNKF